MTRRRTGWYWEPQIKASFDSIVIIYIFHIAYLYLTVDLTESIFCLFRTSTILPEHNSHTNPSCRFMKRTVSNHFWVIGALWTHKLVWICWWKRFFFVLLQAGTHHLKRTDKEPPPLCTGIMSLGQSILFSLEYFPPSDLTGNISSFSRKPSRWLIWQVFLRPVPGKTLFWCHFASPLSVLVRRRRMWGYH